MSKEKQIDIFGGEVDVQEILKQEAFAQKRYRSMQSLYGLKEGHLCKTCKHCELHHYHGRNYYKCALWHKSHSSATDIRVNATACNRYEEGRHEG